MKSPRVLSPFFAMVFMSSGKYFLSRLSVPHAYVCSSRCSRNIGMLVKKLSINKQWFLPMIERVSCLTMFPPKPTSAVFPSLPVYTLYTLCRYTLCTVSACCIMWRICSINCCSLGGGWGSVDDGC